MRRLLLTLAVVYSMGGMAQTEERKWAISDTKSGATVLMGNVGFLLASDWQNTFTIVCKDGTLVSGAESVRFVKTDPSGIAQAQGGNGNAPQLDGYVNNRLTLTGCKEGTHIRLYSATGKEMRSIVAGSGTTTIDVSGLASGTYLLRAGETSVKFMKQ